MENKEVTGRARGGIARAEKLSPEKRREIAKKAAASRWLNSDKADLPHAAYPGELKLGDVKIPCAVLSDGRRVVTENGITVAILGVRSGASKRLKKAQEQEGALLPIFIAPRVLKPFISEELMNGPLSPVEYIDGNRIVRAYDAILFPAVCDIWLKAREAGALNKQQYNKAQKAEILMRSLAKVGIIALIDEATGYQEIRPKEALQAYLDMILRKELAAWAKTFPDEFYKNIYDLKGWMWPGMSKNRFSVVAHYTRNLVYERLAPGLLTELEARSPKNEKGYRKNRFFQWLTEDIGHPMLAQHLHSLIMFQRLALANGHGWTRFVRMVDKVLPRRGDTLALPFPDPQLDS